MTREPWNQPAEERESVRRISEGNRRLSIMSGSFPVQAASKVELQGPGQTVQRTPPDQAQLPQRLQQSETLQAVMNSGVPTVSIVSSSSQGGSMLGSLKSHYRKLRTFKGTVRAIINLKRSPFFVLSTSKAASNLSNGERSAALHMPRISGATASTVQTQVHKLVAEGHVVAEVDPKSGTEVTYRQQGNLDHYTEDNLAKRVSLQQHPHMIALTQRLWNCALGNGEKKMNFADYEAYMLCLHCLILPEFDIDASKKLILDDWKRDSGEQDQLDYPFFHLSMFELVDLWTDTVEPEDYISLLYCITHCLTYFLNDQHKLNRLEDIFAVDILEESKRVTIEEIDQNLQREITSDTFAFYQGQIKLATEGNQGIDRVAVACRTSEHRRQSRSQEVNQTPVRSHSRERKRSSSRSGERESSRTPRTDTTKDSNSTSQRRRSRTGSGTLGQDSPKRKFSVKTNANALNLTADISVLNSGPDGPPPLDSQKHATEMKPVVSPRRETTLHQAASPNTFSRNGGVIVSFGMMNGMEISKSAADGKASVIVPTAAIAAFPRRRSRSASNSSQHRRDQIMQAVSGNGESESPVLHVHHIEAPGLALRVDVPDPNASGYIPGAGNVGKSREPFTVRAAAVAEAAANIAMAAAPVSPRQTFAVQHTQNLLFPRGAEGATSSVSGGATRNIPSNFFINNSSLTAPLVTIVSSKAPTLHEATPSTHRIQLPEAHDARPPTPHGGFTGASISSPRASNAITAQAAGIFISTQQRPAKPPSSPRLTLLRPGSISNSEHQASVSPRKLQQRLQEENASNVATGPGSLAATVTLTISGLATSSNTVEAPRAVQRKSSRRDSSGGNSPSLLSTGNFDAPTAPSQPKDDLDLKALLSPRYIVTNPVALSHPAQLSSNLKQSSIRPQGSVRGFAGVKSPPRIRHQPSSLATGPVFGHLQHRQQHVEKIKGYNFS